MSGSGVRHDDTSELMIVRIIVLKLLVEEDQ